MTNQPTDRGEKLRGLSDFDLGRFYSDTVNGSDVLDGEGAPMSAAFAELVEQIDTEWDRRCAEREAQEARTDAVLWGGHDPSCAGLDELNHRCACGWLQGQSAHNYILGLERERDEQRARAEAAEAELERLRGASLPRYAMESWSNPETEEDGVDAVRHHKGQWVEFADVEALLRPQPQDATAGEGGDRG